MSTADYLCDVLTLGNFLYFRDILKVVKVTVYVCYVCLMKICVNDNLNRAFDICLFI